MGEREVDTSHCGDRPGRGRLIEQARMCLDSAEDGWLAALDAAARGGEAEAAERAWSRLCDHLAIAEQYLKDAEARVMPGERTAADRGAREKTTAAVFDAGSFAAEVAGARAACARLEARGSVLLARAQRPRDSARSPRWRRSW